MSEDPCKHLARLCRAYADLYARYSQCARISLSNPHSEVRDTARETLKSLDEHLRDQNEYLARLLEEINANKEHPDT